MNYYILKEEADPANFVEFWASRYRDPLGIEDLYTKHINPPLTPESVRYLFVWKGLPQYRKVVEEKRHKFVEAVIGENGENLKRLVDLPLKTPEDANNFLTNELKGKGMIWKIFTLHIMHPYEYPIFDQNVYRAMHYMQTGIIKDIPSEDRDKQSSYINDYLPFYNALGHYPDRKLDNALFSFGQFLKISLQNTGTPLAV
jgi:hypothetical protein